MAVLPRAASNAGAAYTSYPTAAEFGDIDTGLYPAALEGRLRRNFQGFTDDDALNLIGLGASGISAFPHPLAQNEKNTGRYRMIASQGQLAALRGIVRAEDGQLRARLIEQLLCRGSANLPPRLELEALEPLAPFLSRNLATLERGHLAIALEGLPYARTIAAIFDPYRGKSVRRFSSAV